MLTPCFLKLVISRWWCQYLWNYSLTIYHLSGYMSKYSRISDCNWTRIIQQLDTATTYYPKLLTMAVLNMKIWILGIYHTNKHKRKKGELSSVRMRENADQNNPEYGHFLRSDLWVFKIRKTDFILAWHPRNLCAWRSHRKKVCFYFVQKLSIFIKN